MNWLIFVIGFICGICFLLGVVQLITWYEDKFLNIKPWDFSRSNMYNGGKFKKWQD